MKDKIIKILEKHAKENIDDCITDISFDTIADEILSLQLHKTQVNSSFFKTKEYPEGSEIVLNEISVNYSQVNENETDTDDNLKLSICHQGAGFYYVLESKRWAFNNIDELVKILNDFKSKAKVE